MLVGPRAGAKTRDHAIPDGLGPDWPSLGVQVTRVESLRPGLTQPLEQGGHLERWSEDLDGAAEVVERRADGQPALTRSDRLWYLAGWPNPDALTRLVSRVATEAGLDLIPMPPGVRFVDAGGTRHVFNYTANAVALGNIPGLGVPQVTLQAADLARFPVPK